MSNTRTLYINQIILFLAIAYQFSAINCCSDGWIKHGDVCYYFSEFTSTWWEAQSYCQAWDSILAEPKSAKTEQFLESIAARNIDHSYFIGITDSIIENKWVYASNGSHVTSLRWYPGEPNGKTAENCGVFFRHLHGNLIDGSCSVQTYFICQKIDRYKYEKLILDQNPPKKKKAKPFKRNKSQRNAMNSQIINSKNR